MNVNQSNFHFASPTRNILCYRSGSRLNVPQNGYNDAREESYIRHIGNDPNFYILYRHHAH